MKNLFLLTALSLLSFSLKAQVITGKVTDRNNMPIEYATVTMQNSDSAYINSVFTDSLGVFKIQSDLKNFRLIVQYMMHDVFINNFSSPNVGTIILNSKENELGEIVVKGERPLVKIEDGKLTYDMEMVTENKVVSNAYEALLQLPGVREQDNAITLAGASSLTVIINGRPSTMSWDQLSNLLKNMPKERIEKAEIMYSTPPQYHVRGSAINLILTNQISEEPRLQGQINGNYTQNYYDAYSTGVSLLYSNKKVSTDFLYSFGYGRNYSKMDIYSKHLYNGQAYNIEQHNIGNNRTQSHNIRLGTEYSIDDKNKINFTYTSQIAPIAKSTENSTGTYSNSINDKINNSADQMHNLSTNYNSGFGMDAGIDYTYYNSDKSQHFRELMSGKENEFKANSQQLINRISTYINQSHTLGAGWTLNYGTKFGFASDKSKQIYESLTGNDLSGSNTNSKIKEYTYDLFAGFSKSFNEQISLSASLTGEYYKLTNQKEKWTLYPQMEATYVISPEHILQYSLSSDKVYPSYWEIHGAIGYLNGYAEIHGNPQLKAYDNYTTGITYIFKNKYIANLSYNYMNSYFVQLPYQSSDRLALIYKTTNFDYKKNITLSFVVPMKIGNILDSRLVAVGYYEKVKNSQFFDANFTNDNFAVFTQLNNTINISSKPNIKFQLDGTYTSDNIQGGMKIKSLYKIDSGVKWLFANDKAEIKIKAEDIFNNWKFKVYSRYGQQNLFMTPFSDTRSVSISFSYKFGDYKEKKRQTVDTSRFGHQ